jgi:glycylpeptide N-tetradecanoyltransferase
MTMSWTIKLYRLPNETVTPGFRVMERRDVQAVTRLLQGYFSQVTVAPHHVDDDVEYLLVSVDYKHMESKAVDEYTLLWQSSFL